MGPDAEWRNNDSELKLFLTIELGIIKNKEQGISNINRISNQKLTAPNPQSEYVLGKRIGALVK